MTAKTPEERIADLGLALPPRPARSPIMFPGRSQETW